MWILINCCLVFCSLLWLEWIILLSFNTWYCSPPVYNTGWLWWSGQVILILAVWLTLNLQRKSLVEGSHADIEDLKDSWFLCHWQSPDLKNKVCFGNFPIFSSYSDHNDEFVWNAKFEKMVGNYIEIEKNEMEKSFKGNLPR